MSTVFCNSGKYTVILSSGKRVRGVDVVALLKLQHKILLELADKHPRNRTIQNAIADANLLGFEVSDHLLEDRQRAEKAR